MYETLTYDKRKPSSGDFSKVFLEKVRANRSAHRTANDVTQHPPHCAGNRHHSALNKLPLLFYYTIKKYITLCKTCHKFIDKGTTHKLSPHTGTNMHSQICHSVTTTYDNVLPGTKVGIPS